MGLWHLELWRLVIRRLDRRPPGRPINHNTWNGCVMDRGYPASPSYLTVSGSSKSGPDTTNNYDTNVAAVGRDAAVVIALRGRAIQLLPASRSMGLNYDWTTMNQLVTNMSPNGNTNQAIGLQLGWLSLVGGGPFYIAGDGSELHVYAGHHPADRRLEHPGPLVHEPEFDRYAPAAHLQQHQRCAASRSTRSRSIPAAIRHRRYCRMRGQSGQYPDSNKFFLLTSASQIMTVFTQIGTRPEPVAHRQ